METSLGTYENRLEVNWEHKNFIIHLDMDKNMNPFKQMYVQLSNWLHS